jgi:predicted O-methyltransferase YrrM
MRKWRILGLILVLCVADLLVTTYLGMQAALVFLGVVAAAILGLLLHLYWVLSSKILESSQAVTRGQITSSQQTQSLFHLFSRIQPRRPLPPMRDMAISPDFASTLVTLVLEQKPKAILELGSGTSTLLCGYCLEQIGAGQVISIDHHGEYAEQTRQTIRDHGLERHVTVLHAGLNDLTLGAGTWQWYDTGFLANLPSVDLLIVDGPPMWLQKESRYPALPVIADYLSPDATILIDDADRPDEKNIVTKWLQEFPGFQYSRLRHEKGTVVLHRQTAAVHA